QPVRDPLHKGGLARPRSAFEDEHPPGVGADDLVVKRVKPPPRVAAGKHAPDGARFGHGRIPPFRQRRAKGRRPQSTLDGPGIGMAGVDIIVRHGRGPPPATSCNRRKRTNKPYICRIKTSNLRIKRREEAVSVESITHRINYMRRRPAGFEAALSLFREGG